MIEEAKDEWEKGNHHLNRRDQVEAQRKRNAKANLTDQQRFELIIEDTEERMWNLHRDPDIDQLQVPT